MSEIIKDVKEIWEEIKVTRAIRENESRHGNVMKSKRRHESALNFKLGFEGLLAKELFRSQTGVQNKPNRGEPCQVEFAIVSRGPMHQHTQQIIFTVGLK